MLPSFCEKCRSSEGLEPEKCENQSIKWRGYIEL